MSAPEKRFFERIGWIGFDFSRRRTCIIIAICFGLSIGYALGFFFYSEINESEDLHLGTYALTLLACGILATAGGMLNQFSRKRPKR